MSKNAPAARPVILPRNCRIAIIAARFNENLVERLLAGCLHRLIERGIARNRIDVYRVPGAFEIPLAAQRAARTGKYAAVICLGAVVRGQTPHFDFVAGQCAAGISRVALDESLPVIFGVLTTNTIKQATDRLGGSHGHTGRSAADAAIEMIGRPQPAAKRAERRK
jgi:6,7-dimethyl-8-ribityllumazine synthase